MVAFLKKCREAVFEDVAELNESKRSAVLIRLLCIVMVVYLFVQAVLFAVFGSAIAAVLPLMTSACFYAVIYSSYKVNTSTTRTFCVVLMYAWIVILVPLVGWNTTGAQNFLLVLLLIAFMTSHSDSKTKLGIAVALCLTRLGLFIYTQAAEPVIKFGSGSAFMFQITNSIAIYFLVTILVWYFSQNSLEAEQKLMKYNKQIEELAEHDALTGLYNRRAIQECIKNELESRKNKKDNKGMCVAIGDLDEFKLVNDLYGHDAGDVVLTKVAEIFETFMRGNGYVARWGGEEFIFIFTRNKLSACEEKLEMLRKTIMLSEIKYKDQTIKVTMTFGLEEHHDDVSINETMINADKKLYQGKVSGRNQVVA